MTSIDQDKVVNLKDHRGRKPTLGRGKRQGASSKSAKHQSGSPKIGLMAYLQFFLFLAVMAYFVRLCQH